MSGTVRLVLAIHNHQPIGNFDGVFEAAYNDSYTPFLDVLENFPEIPISLHNSGSLLEWIVSHHPEYIDRVRQKVQEGQIESLKAWAKTDFVGAKGFLEGLKPVHVPITAQLNQGVAASGSNAPLANLSYKELMKSDEGSKYLENLRATDEAAFVALKKASFPG